MNISFFLRSFAREAMKKLLLRNAMERDVAYFISRSLFDEECNIARATEK